MRAVLVDDSPDLRTVTRINLEIDCGAEIVAEAEDALAGVYQIAAQHPDVAVIDIHMPGVSGVELIRRLREVGCEIRLVAYSSDDEALQDALSAGADAAVPKGHLDVLADAVCPQTA